MRNGKILYNPDYQESDGQDKVQEICQKLGGVLVGNDDFQPNRVETVTLPWYNNVDLVHLVDEQNMTEAHILYKKDDPQASELLDGTNFPIYSMNQKDGFIYSQDTVEAYKQFFLTSVSGRHGHFFEQDEEIILSMLNDQPSPDSVSEEMDSDMDEIYDPSITFTDNVIGEISPSQNVEKSWNSFDNQEARQESYLRFQDKVIKTDIVVENTGKLRIENDVTIQSRLPEAVHHHDYENFVAANKFTIVSQQYHSMDVFEPNDVHEALKHDFGIESRFDSYHM